MHAIPANGARIPALGFGTWTLKGRVARDLVAAAIATGWRHIDTAAMYGNEEDVGAGIRAGGVARDRLFVTTKVWHTDLAARDLRRSAQASLKRLGLDTLDLLLVHWPNPRIPLAETIGALNRAREDGLTRHIGVSNFPTALFAEAVRLSDAPLAANQVEHHPYLDQSKVASACRAAGSALIGYSPLHRGGALLSEEPVAAAAAAHGRTPAQIVLRWHVQQPGTAAIPRTSNPARLAENLEVFDFDLSASEMRGISALQTAGHRLCDYAFSPHWD
ncbi:MAG: aldo/keto reductase [Rhizobiaceae bacterium]|nr:aldo/keto reductase [Rhizobiaceae bacterium]